MRASPLRITCECRGDALIARVKRICGLNSCKRGRVTVASHKAAEGSTGFAPGRRRQRGKRKMGSERHRIILATIGVFILLSAIFVISAGNSFKRDSAHTLAQAELNAKVYTGEL